MLSHKNYGPSLVEIEAGHAIYAVAFSANSEHLFSGGKEGVCVWRVQDGKKIAAMKTSQSVSCLAVSNDGKFLAAGTRDNVAVWETNTYKQIVTFPCGGSGGVDFSSGSDQLIAASNNAATTWDIKTGKEIFTLIHCSDVIAAKYSPLGDRIATASRNTVRVWNSNGTLVDRVNVKVLPWHNTGLLWFGVHLFAVSDKKINEFNTSTGTTVGGWFTPAACYASCIALPRHGNFIVHSSDAGGITFWSTSTHRHLSHIQSDKGRYKIAISADDQVLASASRNGCIVLSPLPGVDSISPSLLHRTFQEPEINIDNSVLDSWKNGQLSQTEVLLTSVITNSDTANDHVLACRALVRTRLGHWDAAIVDAKESVEVASRRSVLGYIAKFVALVGGGNGDEGMQVCDIAFEHFNSTHTTTLLLIKAIVLFMSDERDKAISRVKDLIDNVDFNSGLCVVQAYMYFLVGSECMKKADYEHAVQSLRQACTRLGNHKVQPFLVVSLISGWSFDGLGIKIRQSLCEVLCKVGRISDASQVLLNILDAFTEEEVQPITEWVTDFLRQCLSTPEIDDIKVLTPSKSPSPLPLLRWWARFELTNSSWSDSLAIAISFVHPKLLIYQVLCEHLESLHHVVEAASCFHQMKLDLVQETSDEDNEWMSEFRSRCLDKFKELGKIAMNARRYDDAIAYYTTALSLSPTVSQYMLIQRSKAFSGRAMWEDALKDADKVIEYDSSSPFGYQRKHVALHGAGREEEAIAVFEVMVLQMSRSPDPAVQGSLIISSLSFIYQYSLLEFSRRCIQPTEIRKAIRDTIQKVISETPPVLIETQSGRLLDKSAQASSFESKPIFQELISSITTDIDYVRIQQEVTQYYLYVTFSHKWEDNEPLYDNVVNVSVYSLEDSQTHKKLQNFCRIVLDDGYNWAWSDTCCIDKRDHHVLQEALVSMFKWYHGAAMTIVFLLDVYHSSELGALRESIWNTRAWTLQEYHASKVVRFYTQDWTPYMGLTARNHKESPEIISEMEEATALSAKALMSLRPGMDDIREKLRLASTRQTTRIEDAAYSLLGMFSTSLPVVYGEGDKALGRLLAQLLTGSGDVSVLAWTGKSGGFSSCLPSSINVFKCFQTSHIPQALTNVNFEAITSVLRGSSVSISSAIKLYNRLNDLPVPLFVGQRMKLSCLSFKLGPVLASQDGSTRFFRAQTAALGVVEIRTDEDLPRFGSLYLIHPWIDFLLDRQPVGGTYKETIVGGGTKPDDASSVLGELPSSPGVSSNVARALQLRATRLACRLGLPFGRNATLTTDDPGLRPPSTIAQTEKQMRALGLIARLRQPFGALLFTPTRRNVEEYRRIASECVITVQIEEMSPVMMNNLIRSVRVLDVL